MPFHTQRSTRRAISSTSESGFRGALDRRTPPIAPISEAKALQVGLFRKSTSAARTPHAWEDSFSLRFESRMLCVSPGRGRMLNWEGLVNVVKYLFLTPSMPRKIVLRWYVLRPLTSTGSSGSLTASSESSVRAFAKFDHSPRLIKSWVCLRPATAADNLFSTWGPPMLCSLGRAGCQEQEAKNVYRKWCNA